MMNFVAFKRGHVRLSLWRFVIWALLLAVCLFPIFTAGEGGPKRNAAAGAPQAWQSLALAAAAAAASSAGRKASQKNAHRAKRQRTEPRASSTNKRLCKPWTAKEDERLAAVILELMIRRKVDGGGGSLNQVCQAYTESLAAENPECVRSFESLRSRVRVLVTAPKKGRVTVNMRDRPVLEEARRSWDALSRQEKARYRDKTAGQEAAAMAEGHDNISELTKAKMAAAAEAKGYDNASELIKAQMAAAAAAKGFGSHGENVKAGMAAAAEANGPDSHSNNVKAGQAAAAEANGFSSWSKYTTAQKAAAAKGEGFGSWSEYLTAQLAAAAKGEGFGSWSEYLTAQLAAAAKGEGFGSWSEYIKARLAEVAEDMGYGSWSDACAALLIERIEKDRRHMRETVFGRNERDKMLTWQKPLERLTEMSRQRAEEAAESATVGVRVMSLRECMDEMLKRVAKAKKCKEDKVRGSDLCKEFMAFVHGMHGALGTLEREEVALQAYPKDEPLAYQRLMTDKIISSGRRVTYQRKYGLTSKCKSMHAINAKEVGEDCEDWEDKKECLLLGFMKQYFMMAIPSTDHVAFLKNMKYSSGESTWVRQLFMGSEGGKAVKEPTLEQYTVLWNFLRLLTSETPKGGLPKPPVYVTVLKERATVTKGKRRLGNWGIYKLYKHLRRAIAAQLRFVAGDSE